MNEEIPSWFQNIDSGPGSQTGQSVDTHRSGRFLKWLPWGLAAVLAIYATFATIQWQQHQSANGDSAKEAEAYLGTENDDTARVDVRHITVAGVIDAIGKKSDLMVYVCGLSQATCVDSTDAINQAHMPDTVVRIFYTLDTTLEDSSDGTARVEMSQAMSLLGSAQQPVVVYIQQGRVSDQLRDFSGDAVSQFLAKHQ